MRFLARLDETSKLVLAQYLAESSLLARERRRFMMILLSSEHRMPIADIAQTCGVSQNTVKTWFNRYEAEGFAGLLDRNMAHQSSSLVAVEVQVLESVDAHPQNLAQAVAVLAEKHEIHTSKRIVRRFLKKKVDLAQGT